MISILSLKNLSEGLLLIKHLKSPHELHKITPRYVIRTPFA